MNRNSYSTHRLLLPMLLGCITCVLALPVLAQTSPYDAVRAGHEYVATVTPNPVVPTVVALPLTGEFNYETSFAIYDTTRAQFVPHYIDTETTIKQPEFSRLDTSPSVANVRALVDQNTDTTVSFTVDGESAEAAVMTFYTSEPVTTNEISLELAPFVALPLRVGLRTGTAGQVTETAIAVRQMTDTRLRFPEVTADTFEITLYHIQPLRIAEVRIVPTVAGAIIEDRAVRFLAQPDSRYEVFASADRRIPIALGEAADLRTDVGVMRLAPETFTRNSFYTPADSDEDGVPDVRDNCVDVPNADQLDVNQNGRGDVCDDFDRDGVSNHMDNCVNDPNRNQADEDGDGIGDVCDDAESRFTEANPWVPWVAIGTAALVLLVLFTLIALKPEEMTTDVKEGGE